MVGGAEKIAEEEELVFQDRAAERAAGVVVNQTAVWTGCKVVAGIDAIVFHVLKGRSMERVGP